MPRPIVFLKNKLFQITAIGILGVIIWMILRPGAFAPRYILYSLLLLIPIISVATDWILKNEGSPRLLSYMIVGLCFFYLIGFNGILIKKNVERFDDNPSRNALKKASETLNKKVKAIERVASFNYFTYWLDPKILKSIAGITEMNSLQNINKSEDAWRYLKSNGIKYVLVDSISHGNFIKLLNPEKIPEGINVKKIFDEQNYRIFEIFDANKDI
jgi:hypothetical protein